MKKGKGIILHETTLSSDFGTRENTIIVNEDILSSLASYLSKENTGKTAQPYLIVGESGCGKTFLLKRLADYIKKSGNLSLYPIIIEGKSLFSTEDIWSKCAVHLNIEKGAETFDNIRMWQEENALQIVLLIDNIQYYFKRTDNAEHFNLRGKLNRKGAPILVATSDKVLPALTEYNAAFFDGFKILYTRPLTSSDIENVSNGKYDIPRLEKMMSYQPKTIRALFVSMEISDKSTNPENDLMFLSDYHSSYYQVKYDACVTQIQRILSTLSTSDEGNSLQEIREKTGQDNGKISPYLKLMADQNLIGKKTKTPRGSIYAIADPLFKLWLQHNTI